MKSHIQLMLGDPQTGEQQYQRSSPIAVKVLSPLWTLFCQASQPRDLAKWLGIPKKSDFEGEQDLTAGLAQDWGKQRPYSCRAQTKPCVQQDPGERSSDHIGDWIRPTSWVWKVFCWDMGWQWLIAGTGTFEAAILGGAPWQEPSWRSPFALP